MKNYVMSFFKCLIKEKMLSNAFRESTYLAVGTGTLANNGVLLFLKVFNMTNSLKWLVSNKKKIMPAEFQ